ncbi:transcription repressor OFP12-like [Vicia villosa]|uniref:transcription repressor OFP12-like n=1 Tax=Vicia villosa TaxID=3911 RepID=UPI00273B5C95|nr:transcription repressor OFP12-like [Vicia villosa]
MFFSLSHSLTHCAKMPSLFSKQLHLCFFKLKYPTILSQPHSQQSTTPSPSPSPPYTFHFNTTFTHHHHHHEEDYFSDDTTELPPPDFASVFASQRFFFSSPGSSNSITESESPPNDTPPYNSLIPKGGSVKRVPKYSVNPYVDFLRSMQEMIQSQEQVFDVTNDWDYLHELLLCYLALNPTHTHKYIVQAFTHLLVDLLSSSSSSSSSFSSLSPPSPPSRNLNNRL